MNKAGNGRKAKLIHVSGFLNFLDPAIQDLVGPSDVIVFQRNLVSEAAFDACQYWQGMGKPIVVDLDDAYQMLPWSNPAHRFWIENPQGSNPDPLAMLEEGLRRCDALTAPNRLLLADWSHVARGYYVQNFARREWWEGLPTREELKAKRGLSDRIVIGWGGSVSHYDSWWGTGIREAARLVAKKFPQAVWMICGNDPRIFDELPVPQDQKFYQPGVMPNEWPQIVRTFDIGVAPLHGPYDQRRSWIKGLEYLLAGVPWVGTQGEPYRDLAGLGILIPNSPESWAYAVGQLIKDLEYEQAASMKKTDVAAQWFMDRQLETYGRVYEEVRNNFAASRGRLPGIQRIGS